MIEEVISEILAAENMAEKIKNDAEKTASDELLNAEKRAQDVKNATSARVKARKIKRSELAAQKANEEYEKIIEQSRSEAQILVQEFADAAQKSGERIYRRILNGDC